MAQRITVDSCCELGHLHSMKLRVRENLMIRSIPFGRLTLEYTHTG
jgi:hypothetical protein